MTPKLSCVAFLTLRRRSRRVQWRSLHSFSATLDWSIAIVALRGRSERLRKLAPERSPRQAAQPRNPSIDDQHHGDSHHPLSYRTRAWRAAPY